MAGPLLHLATALLLHAATSAGAVVFQKEALPTSLGYLPVDRSINASLFYAFYEATDPLTPPPDTPLLLWLQGGPGCSGLEGNLFELGPYLIDGASLVQNPFAWNRRFGLLFLDSPLGTGFSAAPSPADIPRRHRRARPCRATGILRRQPLLPRAPVLPDRRELRRQVRARRCGADTGREPESAGGAADQPPRRRHRERAHPPRGAGGHARRLCLLHGLHQRQAKARAGGDAGEGGVTRRGGAVAGGVGREGEGALVAGERDGARHALRLRQAAPVCDGGRGHVREQRGGQGGAGRARRRGVGAVQVCNQEVRAAVHEDIMKSVKPEMEAVLLRGRTRVLLYQGIRDIKIGAVSTEALLKELSWDGLRAFQDAERAVWRISGEEEELAGYVQRSGALTHTVVYGAGHLVPADNGRAAQEMIEDWVTQTGVFGHAGSRLGSRGLTPAGRLLDQRGGHVIEVDQAVVS